MLVGLFLAAAIGSPPIAAVHTDELAAYESMLLKAARDADANFAGSPCPDATVEHVARQPVKIADHPDFAALNERLKVTGCGRSTTQNVHVGRFGGSPPWRMVVGLPGDSMADMPLQQSTLPAALAQARVEAPGGCKGQQLGEAYVAARPGHVDILKPGQTAASVPGHFKIQLPQNVEAQRDRLDTSKAWVEVWPIEICGSDRTTAVLFIPLRDQPQTAYIFLPVWRQMLEHGQDARPKPDRPTD
jgi:hypothetical protein